jgi:hypothetical protein
MIIRFISSKKSLATNKAANDNDSSVDIGLNIGEKDEQNCNNNELKNRYFNEFSLWIIEKI